MHYSMKAVRSVVFCLAIVGAAIPAVAQTPTAELSGGYQFLRFSSEGEESESLPGGWYADVAFNLNEMIGIVGEVGGNYKSDSLFGVTVDQKVHEFMGGVRVSSRRNPMVVPFGQFLVGGANYSASGGADIEDLTISISDSETNFAIQAGGGVNVRLTDRVGARVGADYLRAFHEVSDTNIFRFVVGINVSFGMR